MMLNLLFLFLLHPHSGLGAAVNFSTVFRQNADVGTPGEVTKIAGDDLFSAGATAPLATGLVGYGNLSFVVPNMTELGGSGVAIGLSHVDFSFGTDDLDFGVVIHDDFSMDIVEYGVVAFTSSTSPSVGQTVTIVVTGSPSSCTSEVRYFVGEVDVSIAHVSPRPIFPLVAQVSLASPFAVVDGIDVSPDTEVETPGGCYRSVVWNTAAQRMILGDDVRANSPTKTGSQSSFANSGMHSESFSQSGRVKIPLYAGTSSKFILGLTTVPDGGFLLDESAPDGLINRYVNFGFELDSGDNLTLIESGYDLSGETFAVTPGDELILDYSLCKVVYSLTKGATGITTILRTTYVEPIYPIVVKLNLHGAGDQLPGVGIEYDQDPGRVCGEHLATWDLTNSARNVRAEFLHSPLFKDATTSDSFNAGAMSVETLNGDGYVEITVSDRDTQYAFGVGHKFALASSDFRRSMVWGFFSYERYRSSAGNRLYEMGLTSTHNFISGDNAPVGARLGVNVTGCRATLMVDGVVYAELSDAMPVIFPLHIVVALGTANATIINPRLHQTGPDYEPGECVREGTFRSDSFGVSQANGRIAKNPSLEDGWGNAVAVGKSEFAGDGTLEFMFDTIDGNYIVGFQRAGDDPPTSIEEIELGVAFLGRYYNAEAASSSWNGSPTDEYVEPSEGTYLVENGTITTKLSSPCNNCFTSGSIYSFAVDGCSMTMSRRRQYLPVDDFGVILTAEDYPILSHVMQPVVMFHRTHSSYGYSMTWLADDTRLGDCNTECLVDPVGECYTTPAPTPVPPTTSPTPVPTPAPTVQTTTAAETMTTVSPSTTTTSDGDTNVSSTNSSGATPARADDAVGSNSGAPSGSSDSTGVVVGVVVVILLLCLAGVVGFFLHRSREEQRAEQLKLSRQYEAVSTAQLFKVKDELAKTDALAAMPSRFEMTTMSADTDGPPTPYSDLDHVRQEMTPTYMDVESAAAPPPPPIPAHLAPPQAAAVALEADPEVAVLKKRLSLMQEIAALSSAGLAMSNDGGVDVLTMRKGKGGMKKKRSSRRKKKKKEVVVEPPSSSSSSETSDDDDEEEEEESASADAEAAVDAAAAARAKKKERAKRAKERERRRRQKDSNAAAATAAAAAIAALGQFANIPSLGVASAVTAAPSMPLDPGEKTYRRSMMESDAPAIGGAGEGDAPPEVPELPALKPGSKWALVREKMKTTDQLKLPEGPKVEQVVLEGTGRIGPDGNFIRADDGEQAGGFKILKK